MEMMAYWQRYGSGRFSKLAADAGTKVVYLKHIAHGRKRPGTVMAHRLVSASGGMVRLQDLLLTDEQMAAVRVKYGGAMPTDKPKRIGHQTGEGARA